MADSEGPPARARRRASSRRASSGAARAALSAAILAGLVAQNTLVVVLMALAKRRAATPFSTSAVVVTTEMVKFALSLAALLLENPGSPEKVGADLVAAIANKEVLLLAVPSMLYLVQNNLTFVALGYLDAAVFQVMYQLKVVFAALAAYAMLGRRVDAVNQLAIALLFSGVCLVALSTSKTPAPKAAGGADAAANSLRTAAGIGATLAAAILSAVAGTYTEKLFKAGSGGEGLNRVSTSLWFKNLVLAGFSCVLGLAMTLQKDGGLIRQHGFFRGFTGLVWFVIFLQACGGLLIGAVLKYTSNMAKTFATAISMVTSSMLSVVVFGFQPTFAFVIGAALVAVAVGLYGSPPPLRARVSALLDEAAGALQELQVRMVDDYGPALKIRASEAYGVRDWAEAVQRGFQSALQFAHAKSD